MTEYMTAWAWNVGGYLAVAAAIGLIAYLTLIGILFVLRPREWARSPFALYPEQFLDLLDRPLGRFQMRFVGLVLAIFSLSMGLHIFGVDAADLHAVGTGLFLLYWVISCGPVLLFAGLYFVILPKSLDGSKWAPLALPIQHTVRNSLVLQLAVRAFGLCCCWVSWHIMAGLLSGTPSK